MSDRPEIDPQNAPIWITVASGIVVAIVGLVRSIATKRLDLRIKTTPSWNEVMKRLDDLELAVDRERDLRRDAQQAARIARDETRAVKSVFRAFVDRVTAKYPGVELSPSERALLDSEPDYPDVDDTIDTRFHEKET